MCPFDLKQGGQNYSYLYDGKGNVTAMLDGSQAVAVAYTYDAFGKLMSQTGSLSQPFKFSTKYYDEGTGLSYFGYRFYSPLIGRWIAPDPVGFTSGLNLYEYAKNDPMNWIDPWGLTEEGAMTVYGETRGLYPQLLPKTTNVYSRKNWLASGDGSFEELQEARKYIADIRERNKRTKSKRPSPKDCKNQIEMGAWNDAVDATAGAENWDLPDDVKNFYIRQGDASVTPDYAKKQGTVYTTFGPFINVGGGDVPKGDRTYVDIWEGVP